MKIKLTKKIRIEINRRTLIAAFSIMFLVLLSAYLFFGFDLSHKTGTAEEVKKDTSLEINTKKIEEVSEYKFIGDLINPTVGVGKAEPF